MPDNAAELAGRLFGGNGAKTYGFAQGGKLPEIPHRAGDTPAQGAAGAAARRLQRQTKGDQLFIHQRPAGATLRGVEPAAGAQPDIGRPALALQHMHQGADLIGQRSLLRQLTQLLLLELTRILEPVVCFRHSASRIIHTPSRVNALYFS